MDLANLVKTYYVNPRDFKYLRQILDNPQPYKIKYSVDLNKLTEQEIMFNGFRLALEHYIENELINQTLDKEKYDELLTEFNRTTIYYGYKPYYKTSCQVPENLDALKDFPTPYYRGHSKNNDKFYPICDYLPVNNYITPRYYRPRVYSTNPITIYPKPVEWSYDSPAPPPAKLNIIQPSQSNNHTDRLTELTIDPIRSDGIFSLNNKRVHLTYSYHPDLQALLSHLHQIITAIGNKIITHSLVHETGNHKPLNQPHPHTHVALEFEQQLRTKNTKFFDYICPTNPPSNPNFQHPHIRPVKYKNHWNIICNEYHRKENQPLTNYNYEESQTNTYDLHEAVSIYKELGENGIAEYINRTRPNDISRVDSICKTVKKFIQNENDELKKQDRLEQTKFELNPWHEQMIHHEIPNNDDRILIWIYDVVGNEQKTLFADYMECHHNAVIITVTTSKDALCQLAGEVEKRNGEPIKTVIFDIPRSAKNMEDLYETIELVKNGSFTSQKYKTKKIHLGCKPAVIVLSNTHPILKRCSVDRWKILTLRNGQIQHMFLDDEERDRHKEISKVISEMESKGITNELTKSYQEPFHMWPIETFPAGKQYINLIQELLDTHQIPEIKMEYRPLTSEEILHKRILIKSYSELREKLFNDVDKSIVPFAEQTFRCIYYRELQKGYIWDVSDIGARPMTPEEITNHEANKNRIIERQSSYRNKKLEKFKQNLIERIVSY